MDNLALFVDLKKMLQMKLGWNEKIIAETAAYFESKVK